MNYNIEKVATLIGARRYGDADVTIGWLLTDSRSLCFPEQTLFFALRTQRNDGHRYIGDLYRRGVRAFVVENLPTEAGDDWQTAFPGANFLKVPSPLAALQRLAERHRDEFDIPVVGITGSNGKTWVKEWLYQILMKSGKAGITRSPRSYNSQIGVPLSVWLLNEQSRIGIFEAGISRPGEMLALRDIIQPTIGVFTSLGNAHQENFRSKEEKCMEKLQLFHDTEVIVYPSDDDTVSRCMRRSQYKGERIGWSRYNETAPMYIAGVEEVRSTEDNQQADDSTTLQKVSYVYKGTAGSYCIAFIDEASVENSITCATVALYLGLTPDEVSRCMAKLEPIAMRMEVKQGQRGLTLINDSYNNDINSLDIALDFMARRSRERVLILSDIYQSGESSAELYSQVASLAKERGVNRLIGIGPEISAQAALFSVGEKSFFATTEAFLHSTLFNSLHDGMVLLKGARQFGFERISDLLEQKVHETILEVDLNAVANNLNHFRSLLKPETKMVCMIKANAYGAGAIEIARTLQDHRVDYLAVATADEGAELRRAGITQNIIVMNPEMSSFKTLFDYDLEPEVYSFRIMDALVRAARAQGITGWPVHIKFDTGMHRLGFNVCQEGKESGELDELIARLQSQQAIIPRSVFTHFVGSDSDDFDAFSARQFRLFDEASRRLQAAFPHKILRHIDNSAGIEHFPERQLDMCRLGIGLYGVEPYQMRDEKGEMRNAGDSNSSLFTLHSSLQCVSTLKTTILQLRHVPKEETVGYSRKGVLTRDSVIAAIPIGYADGLNRRLGCRHGYCLVNGQKAEYVGNICMDVALIDVTDIPCQEGDQVEIFGKNLPVSLISSILETIPYEVLTSVSDRVKRVYFQD